MSSCSTYLTLVLLQNFVLDDPKNQPHEIADDLEDLFDESGVTYFLTTSGGVKRFMFLDFQSSQLMH
jgi:hypothetical protein